MPQAGADAASRMDAHIRWAGRYNDAGVPAKAVAHFGRALDYSERAGFGGKPECRYGNKCYLKNPEHLEKYSHPWDYAELEMRIKNAPSVNDGRFEQVAGSYEDIERAIKAAAKAREELTGDKRPAPDAPVCEHGGRCTIAALKHIIEYRH
jgi:hypothetical protein